MSEIDFLNVLYRFLILSVEYVSEHLCKFVNVRLRSYACVVGGRRQQQQQISHSKIEFILHPLVSFVVVVLGAGVVRGGITTFLQVLGQDILATMMTSTLLTMDHIVHDKDHWQVTRVGHGVNVADIADILFNLLSGATATKARLDGGKMLIDADLVEVVCWDVVHLVVLLIGLLMHYRLLLGALVMCLLIPLFKWLLALAALAPRRVRHNSLCLSNWLQGETRGPCTFTCGLLVVMRLWLGQLTHVTSHINLRRKLVVSEVVRLSMLEASLWKLDAVRVVA